MQHIMGDPAHRLLVWAIADTIREKYGPICVAISEEDNSPWLNVTVYRTQPHDATEPHEWQLAIWRTTNALHTVDENGAVSDDPIPIASLEI
jgi:hypothetical protein